MPQYAVHHSHSGDYLGTIRQEGDTLEITHTDPSYGSLLDDIVVDAKAEGAEATLSRMSRYYDFEEVESGEVVKGEDEGDDEDATARVIEAHGRISKIDKEHRNVFGWAYVTHDKDGNVVVDKSGEFVDEYEEIERAAYQFVVKHRAGDMDHTNQKTSEMIESMVFTPEKIEKMGLPKGVLPTGWWVGFHIEDDSLWDSVKKGERLAFSIHGKGTRKQVPDDE